MQLGGDAMHAGVVRTYINASVRMLAPVAPHWADHVFRNILKAGDTVLTAGWPQLPAPDYGLKMAAEYIERLIAKIRTAIDKREAPPKKKKGAPPAAPARFRRSQVTAGDKLVLQTGLACWRCTCGVGKRALLCTFNVCYSASWCGACSGRGAAAQGRCCEDLRLAALHGLARRRAEHAGGRVHAVATGVCG